MVITTIKTSIKNPTVNTIQTSYSSDTEMVIQIRGIYNEKATSQRAVFQCTSGGKNSRRSDEFDG